VTSPETAERREVAAARRKARYFAVQALYQWSMAGNSPAEIERHFREEFDFQSTDLPYFQELLHRVPADVAELDALLRPFLNIPEDKLGTVERAVLRIGTYELKSRLDVPFRVVIHEAVALARKFGAAESHRFVNAVLDKVARQLRSAELRAPH
jgi:transcription antitermination protein NusB